MSYNLQLLFANLDAQFSQNPGMTLHALAHTLGVDRHTIERATRQCSQTSFREYRQYKLLSFALALLSQSPTLTLKELAAKLGYQSSEALSRFLRLSSGKTFVQMRQAARNAKLFANSANSRGLTSGKS